MAKRSEHFDAQDNIFFARELQQTLAQQWDVKYTERVARKFVATGELIHPGVNTVRREIYDGKGTAKRASNPSDDAPQVSLSAGEDFATMNDYHLGCSWSDQEIRTAQLVGKPIDRMRMDMVRKGLLNAMDDHIAVGDSGAGNLGLLNQSGTNDVTSDLTGGWLGAATPDQILADLTKIVDKIANVTNDVEQTKRLILPTILERKLNATARSTTSDTTVLEYFKRNRPGIEVMTWERCNLGNPNADKHRIVAYDPDVMNIRFLLSYEFEMDAPERKGRSQKCTAWLRDGGVWLMAPKTLTYADIAAS